MKHYQLYLTLLLFGSSYTPLAAMDCGDVAMAEPTHPCVIIEQLQQWREQEFTKTLAFQPIFTAIHRQATATELLLLEIWQALHTQEITPRHDRIFREIITPIWEQATTDLQKVQAEISRDSTILAELAHIHTQAATTQEAELVQQCVTMLTNEITMAQEIQRVRSSEQEKIYQIYSKMDALLEERVAKRLHLEEDDVAEEQHARVAEAEAPPQTTRHTCAAYQLSEELSADDIRNKRTTLHTAVLACVKLHRDIVWHANTLAALEQKGAAKKYSMLELQIGLYPENLHREMATLEAKAIDQKHQLKTLLCRTTADTLGARDISGKTALHYAAHIDNEAIITMIINKAPTPEDKKKLLEISDLSGYTALDYAKPDGLVATLIKKIAPHIPQKRLTEQAMEHERKRLMAGDDLEVTTSTAKSLGWVIGGVVAAAAAAIATTGILA